MPKVIIDGVDYIPAKEALVNETMIETLEISNQDRLNATVPCVQCEMPCYVWVFEQRYDPYESGWHLMSLHRTAKGCFKQMTRIANQTWYTERTLDLQFGKNEYWPLIGQKWRMRKVFLDS